MARRLTFGVRNASRFTSSEGQPPGILFVTLRICLAKFRLPRRSPPNAAEPLNAERNRPIYIE